MSNQPTYTETEKLKIKLIENELRNFKPIVSPANFHPLRQEKQTVTPVFSTPLGIYPNVFAKPPSNPPTLPLPPQPSSQQPSPIVYPPGFSPMTSNLRHSEFFGKDYSVTKINTQSVPFVYLVIPDYHHQQPVIYKNEKINIQDPSTSSVAKAVNNCINFIKPTSRPRKIPRPQENSNAAVEIEMSTFPVIPQDFLDLNLN